MVKYRLKQNFVALFLWKVEQSFNTDGLRLSPLNYHLFQYNINDNPFCAQCGSEFETSIHFFALCPSYDVDRVILRNSIRLLLPLLPDFLCHTINIDNDECFVKLLLTGVKVDILSQPLNDLMTDNITAFNYQLCTNVIRFMYNSIRFATPSGE